MSTLARMISSAFPGGQHCLRRPEEPFVVSLGRRLKLWELAHAYHCALIGTCLPVPEMRKLAPHSGYDVSNMTDYSLHTVVVGYCEERGALSEAIQRFLDKRHAQAIARFTPAKSTAEVAHAWREALAAGTDIPGALWAAWTHPASDEELSREIHGDIHMLSHQVGATVRAELRQLEQAKRDAARLRAETNDLRASLDTTRQARDDTVASLRRELDAARQRIARYERQEREFAAAARIRLDHAGQQRRAATLAERVARLERIGEAATRRIVDLESELGDARVELAAAEQALVTALGATDVAACNGQCPPGPALEGRCVLCVGGRSGLVEGYRKLVEQRGGRFLHHDGGQEEHLHRIDAAIAGADAVVCQTGCVSHAAYWRLKDACKKLGKPCVFVQSPGVGSFARGLAALANAAPTDQVIRLAPHS